MASLTILGRGEQLSLGLTDADDIGQLSDSERLQLEGGRLLKENTLVSISWSVDLKEGEREGSLRREGERLGRGGCEGG